MYFEIVPMPILNALWTKIVSRGQTGYSVRMKGINYVAANVVKYKRKSASHAGILRSLGTISTARSSDSSRSELSGSTRSVRFQSTASGNQNRGGENNWRYYGVLSAALGLTGNIILLSYFDLYMLPT